MRALLLALCMLACTAAYARSYAVDDLLRIESYGQTLIVGDLLLIEKRRPYVEASDFAYDTYFTSRMVTRIVATSLTHPGALEPLFHQDRNAGYWIGSLSPRQTKLAVFRLQDRTLSLGVVDLKTGAVRWLRSAPDLPNAAPAPIWIDEEHLAYVTMTHPRLPASLLMGTAGTQDVAELWHRQATGGLTRTVVSTRSGADPDDGDRWIVVVSVITGRERPLVSGNIVDLSLAPGGRHLAVITAGLPVAPPPRPINGGFDSRRHSLRVVNVATGRAIDVSGDVLRGVMSWSADARLLVVSRDGGSDWTRARWLLIDAAGGTRPLGGADVYASVEETGAGRLACAGWAGTSAVALVRKASTAPVWMRLTPDHAVELPFTAAARPAGSTPTIKWMLDGKLLYAVTGTTTQLVVHDVAQAGPALLDPYARGFRLIRDPETLPLAIVATPRRRTVRPLDEHGKMLRGIDVPPATQVLGVGGGRVIFIETDRRSATRLLIARRGRRAVVVDRLNEALADIDLPRAIDLKTIGADGETLHDWLLLPASSRAMPESRLPLVVNPYPGLAYGAALPNEAGVSRYAVSDNALALVSAGYAVLLPSMPLDTPGNPADDILPRIDAATDAAVATGLVDPERIGLIGHSFGGYAALLVATRSARYKAIVAANGPYDLIAAHGLMLTHDKLRLDNGISAAASIGWAEGGQAGIGAPPSEAAAAYIAASPMLHLDHVQNPVLLIAGDLDIVDVTQGERAFMELYRHGKDARLIRYWGENHTNASPANIRDYWQVIVRFLDEHLKSATPSRP